MIFNAGDHYLITQCALALACLYSCLIDWIMNTITAVGNLTRQSETSPQLWILAEQIDSYLPTRNEKVYFFKKNELYTSRKLGRISWWNDQWLKKMKKCYWIYLELKIWLLKMCLLFISDFILLYTFCSDSLKLSLQRKVDKESGPPWRCLTCENNFHTHTKIKEQSETS